MVSKYSPGDIVVFEHQIYLVKTVALMNPNILFDPFVCGLVPIEKPNSFRQLLVREALLTRCTKEQSEKALKVLYGNKDRRLLTD